MPGHKWLTGVMRLRNSRAMPTKIPDSPSNIPADEPISPLGKNRSGLGASSIQYVGAKEPKVTVLGLIIGLVVVAAAIIGFLHFH